MKKTYQKMMTLNTFNERAEYLRCNTEIGIKDRSLSHAFYKSKEWRRIRDYVILRDGGCDLAIPERVIKSQAIVHHINPLTEEDFKNHTENLFDLDNLVCVSIETHNYIHYGRFNIVPKYAKRKKNDTVPWR